MDAWGAFFIGVVVGAVAWPLGALTVLLARAPEIDRLFDWKR